MSSFASEIPLLTPVRRLSAQDPTWKIVSVYVVFSSLWILLSDQVLVRMIPAGADPETLALLATLKGWAFVAVSATMLLGLIRAYAGRLLEAAAAREQAERALRVSEELLRSYFDDAPVAILVANEAGRFMDCNRAACQLTGLTRAAILNLTIPGIHPPADLAKVQETLDTLAARGTAEENMRLLRGDGDTRLVTVRAVRMANGWSMAFLQDVTAQAAVDEARRANQELMERQARIARTLPGTLYSFRMSPDGRFSLPYSSAPLEEFFGISAETLAGDSASLFAMMPPEESGPMLDSIVASARDLTPWRREFRVRHPDKGERWLVGHSIPTRDGDGGTTWHGFLMDITVQKTAEAAIRQSEGQLRALVATLPDALFINQDDRIVFANHQAQQLWRAQGPDEILGRTPFDFIHPEERAAVRERLRRLFADGGVAPGWETRMLALDGTVIPVETTASLIQYGARPAVQVLVRNIRERKQAQAALQEREERFRQMAESIDEVFWMTNADQSCVLYVNPAYERIWGRPCADLYAHPANWLAAVVPEDRERVARAVAAGGAGGFREEYRIARPDGSIRWIYDRGFPVKNAAGEVHRMVGSAHDITERKSLEAQFLRAQRLEAVGTLAGGVAHDLNNILAPVLMAAGLVRTKLTDAHDLKLLGMVEASAQRGAAIIRQLLTFSRGIDGARIDVQLRHLMKEMVHLMQETFPRNIEVSHLAPADLWTVSADATQMDQVLMNLCVNARDALPHGGRIALRAENAEVAAVAAPAGTNLRPGRWVILSVADTGTGIAPELLDRIFDPFFTTKEIGKGTGLGLSTVMGIVKSHGGFVTVESKVGQGTTFRVHLPATEPRAAATGPVASERPATGRGELILVVDDEPLVRDSIRFNLEAHGYRVLSAADGREAVNLFLKYQDTVRLVLTDMMMPAMGGTALVRALKTIKPDLKVIATTGLNQEDRQAEMASLDVPDILAKPCSSADLLRATRRILDQ